VPGSDVAAVADTVRILQRLWCPDVRRGENNPEFVAKLGPRRVTPDIIVGPFRGNKDPPRDFYVDVQQPRGDYFVNPEAGVADAHALFESRLGRGPAPRISTLGVDHFKRMLVAPIERKIEKYGRRRNSPLFGHVLYFGGRATPTEESV
jgi:hypothetical protein